MTVGCGGCARLFGEIMSARSLHSHTHERPQSRGVRVHLRPFRGAAHASKPGKASQTQVPLFHRVGDHLLRCHTEEGAVLALVVSDHDAP